MPVPKEADLNVALLQYIAACFEIGDDASLGRLGLNRDDAEGSARLTFAQLQQLRCSRFSLLRPQAIDRDLYWRLLTHIQALQARNAVRDALLLADAPFALMHHYFGMDSSDYAERGRALGVVRGMGRPSVPSDADELAAWQVYDELRGREDELTGEDCLELQRRTALPLRQLWAMIQTWQQQGQPAKTRQRRPLSLSSR